MARQTILVVDDEVAIGRLVRICLEKAGYRVLLADSGQSAMTIYDAHCGEVRLLLTDVIMPKMDGLELAGRVHERGPETRILLMSGTHASGGNGFGCLAKPFTPAELIDKIGKLLA